MSLILIENTVLLYLCDTEEAALHQIVLNIIERELSENGLTLHQHTEQKYEIIQRYLLHLFHQQAYHQVWLQICCKFYEKTKSGSYYHKISAESEFSRLKRNLNLNLAD